MKEAALIPGYGQSARTDKYADLRSIIESHYDKVHIVDVNWQAGTYEDWLLRVKNTLLPVKQSQFDLVGYSMGGLLALDASGFVQVSRLCLLSMSSMGGPKSREVAQDIGAAYADAELMAFEPLRIDDMVRNSSARYANVFYGGQESSAMRERSENVAHLLGERATLVAISTAGHDDALCYPYLDAVSASFSGGSVLP